MGAWREKVAMEGRTHEPSGLSSKRYLSGRSTGLLERESPFSLTAGPVRADFPLSP